MPQEDARQLLVSKPLAAVASAFESHRANPDALRTGAPIHVKDEMAALLKGPGLGPVPSLNPCRPEEIPVGALVRFVGMVQDVQDPEFYAGVYEERLADGTSRLATCKYRDGVSASVGTVVIPRDDFTWTRTPMVCVPIPSQTVWAAQATAGESPRAAAAAAPATGASHKRSVDEDEPSGGGAEPMEQGGAEPMDEDEAPRKQRRATGDEPAATEDVLCKPYVCVPCDRGAAWQRAPTGTCLLKVYDEVADGSAADIRVNDLVEVYGVLEIMGDEFEGGYEMPDGTSAGALGKIIEQERALRPPPSAQPRLHCLLVQRLEPTFHPLLPVHNSYEEVLAVQAARAHVLALRPVVVSALSSALGGDSLAAEYVLLASISRVLSRMGEAPLGKLALNVTGCPSASGPGPSPAVRSVQAVLETLLPWSTSLSMTIDALNGAPLVPRKDHDANCLRAGQLQLPKGAMLLLDETGLAAGQLNDAGVKNVRALADLLNRQKLAYDFTYFSVDFEADVSLISFSASKSLLPFNVHVPLRVEPFQQPLPPQLQDERWLHAARTYIGLASRAGQASLPDELTQALQDDFVQARAASPEISADDFSRWLTCMRLQAASTLASEISIEHYQHIKALENARTSRLCTNEVQL